MWPQLGLAIAALLLVVLLWACTVLFIARSAKGQDDLGLKRYHHMLHKTVVLLAIAFSICSLVLLAQYLIGAILHILIENYSVSFLGVGVRMKSLQLNPFKGAVFVSGLRVSNPPGFHKPFLAAADTMFFDLNIAPVIFSLAHHIPIEELVVRGAKVNYEQGLPRSNVKLVLDRLQGAEDDESKKRTFSLHRVDITDVRATASFAFVPGPEMTITAGDVKYDDFERQVGVTKADDIIRVIFSTVLKSVGNAFE